MLTGKQKFQRGNNKNKAGKCLNSNLSGETSFLGGSSFKHGGAMFQRGRYWGVFKGMPAEHEFQRSSPLFQKMFLCCLLPPL